MSTAAPPPARPLRLQRLQRSSLVPCGVIRVVRRALAALNALTALTGLLGCQDAAPSRGCEGLPAGALVISEVLANPSGTDDGREWVELTNTTSTPVPLGGVSLVLSAADGTGTREHVIATTDAVAAGAYYVLGSALDAARPAYVNYGFGTALGELSNTAGRVLLRCGGRVLDQVVYLDTVDGASRAYDGALPPNTTANDETTRWCDSTVAFSTGDFGSPGARNAACGSSISGRCREDGVERDTVPPTEGDLIITELHADPHAVTDSAGEWFELLALADVDLNGLQLGKVTGTVLETLSGGECLSVSAGTYLLFGASRDELTNGGLSGVDYVADLALSNGGGSLFIGHGGGVLDTFAYTHAETGASTQLDPRHLSFEENDDESLWCRGTEAYGHGDRGTPRSVNAQCMFPVPDGMCEDGGALRAIVAPRFGDVVITEVMPDPGAVGEAEGEWFEAYFASDADLNGLELGTTPGSVSYRVQQAACLRVAGGRYVVFAKDAQASNGVDGGNGGLPRDAIDYDTLTLANNATAAKPRTLFVGVGGAVLDTALWFTSSAGVARSLSNDARDATLNDMANHWCAAAASDTYGLGDRGTPGAANPACPFVLPAGHCLENGVARPLLVPRLGDVVITEVLPDPSAVRDPFGEWFELHANVDVDLNGLQIGSTFGSPGFTLTRDDCVHVTAGSDVLLAHSADPSINGGLPTVLVEHGRALSNNPGSLFVGVADVLLDEVHWISAPSGVSLQLDPSALSHTRNDVFDTAACHGAGVYGAGDRGTPGASNRMCPVALQPGQCLDGSVMRAVVVPALGDLVITEVMPDPSAVSDPQGEWFEVHARAAVDLNGLQAGTVFGSPSFTLTRSDCVRVTPGDTILFARVADSRVNGGLPASAIAYGFALANDPGSLFIGVDNALLDAVTWSASPTGKSLQLEPSDFDPSTNDAFVSVACQATTRYGLRDLGTPGAPNLDCFDMGECWDGLRPRSIVSPKVGELYINEVMPNPATTETSTEWFELVPTVELDLNGLIVTNGTQRYVFSSLDCLAVSPGEYLVFARSTDPMSNGGVSGVGFTYASVSMTNDNSTLSIVSGDTTLDTVTWGATLNGRARALIAGQPAPHLGNDSLSHWCSATTPYGDVMNKNFGTPGALNQCP